MAAYDYRPVEWKNDPSGQNTQLLLHEPLEPASPIGTTGRNWIINNNTEDIWRETSLPFAEGNAAAAPQDHKIRLLHFTHRDAINNPAPAKVILFVHFSSSSGDRLCRKMIALSKTTGRAVMTLDAGPGAGLSPMYYYDALRHIVERTGEWNIADRRIQIMAEEESVSMVLRIVSWVHQWGPDVVNDICPVLLKDRPFGLC